MSRLSIGRLIAIAMVATIVLLISIDTTLACRYLWRSHSYRSCAPVYYYCPPAPCHVTSPSYGSTTTAPAPANVQESTELPEPPPAEDLDPADATTDSPSDTGFSDALDPDVSDTGDDPSDALVDEPEIVDDLPDVADDSDVFDLPEEPTELPDDTTDLPADDTDPLGNIFDEPGDDLPDDATDLPDDSTDLPADDTDPLGNLFDETGDDLPDDTSDLPADDLDADADPLSEIFDEPADDGGDADLPTDDGGDSLDGIFDEPLPGEDDAADSGDEDELMDDLFGGAEPADSAEPRIANNPDEDSSDEEDELFRELEEATELPTDDLDAADELFPLEEEDTNGANDASSDTIDDELNDLFGGLPEKETLGFHEVKVAEPKPAEPVVDNQPREIEVAPRDGVTRNVERFKPTVRVWTDNTGMYTTVGRLVKIGETHVRLLKENGRFSTVAKRRLSQADLVYVEEMVKYLGIEELDYVARR